MRVNWAIPAVFVLLLLSRHVDAQSRDEASWQEAYYAGTSAYAMSRYQEAEEAWLRALTIATAIAPDDSRVGETLKGLAAVYRRTNRADDAERAYQNAMVVYERNGECTSADCLEILKQLASLFEDQGRYEDAKTLRQRELIGREQLGSDHRISAIAARNLGRNAQDRGDLEAAEVHYRHALELLAQGTEKENDPMLTSSVRLDLVRLQVERGNLDAAEAILRGEITDLDAREGPDRDAFLADASDLYAGLLVRSGRTEEATKWKARSRALREKLGHEKP